MKGLHERAPTNQQFDGSKKYVHLIHRYWKLILFKLDHSAGTVHYLEYW